MSRLFLICAGGLFWLFLHAAASAQPAELPGGDSDAFRNRMTDWSAPPRPVSAPLPEPPKVERRAAGPLRLPPLSSGFGARRHPIAGGVRLHAGVDMPGPTGTLIRASAAGIVRRAGWAGGYGNLVEIDHGGGLTTRYAHLSRLLVVRGAAVAQGDPIGRMASTGRSTGSHLHFEVRVNGVPTDPLAHLGAAPASFSEAPPPSAPLAPSVPHVSDFARATAAAQGRRTAP